MPFQREPRVLDRHAAAVVADEDPVHAPAIDLHVDARRPGVERVFDQLLDDRGRPLHDLARGDPVDDLLGEAVDAGHEGAV